MLKHFVLTCHNFTPSQAGKFENMLDGFFEDVMCEGRSRASYDLNYVSKGTEIVFRRPAKQKKAPELFVGSEETNIHEFYSPCHRAPLSLEPLCKVCCGVCGQQVEHKNAIHKSLLT